MVLSWTHIHRGSIRFYAPSSASESEITPGSLVATVYAYKSEEWLIKKKDYKDIEEPGKENIHFSKYDNFVQYFMEYTLCKLSW